MVVWFWAKFPCNGFPPIFFAQNPIQLHRVLSPTCLIGGSPPCFKQFTACPPATVGSSLTCSQTNTVCISTENIEQQRRQIVGKWASAALLPPIRCCCLLMSETARKWPPARFSTIYYPPERSNHNQIAFENNLFLLWSHFIASSHCWVGLEEAKLCFPCLRRAAITKAHNQQTKKHGMLSTTMMVMMMEVVKEE